MKHIFNLKQDDVLGLDIGSSSVKIVALNKDEKGFIVKTAGIAEIAPGPVNEFNPASAGQNTENTVKAIRKCFESARLGSKTKFRKCSAVCGVCGPDVAVRDFEFPPLAPEDVEGAVTLEAAQVCPFNADQAAVDYQLISNGSEKTKGFLVAATNVLVTNKMQLAKKAGFKGILMDIEGLALLNCFHELSGCSDKSSAAILNVGSAYTTLAAMNSDGWPFIRDTAFAGNDILKQLAEGNNISFDETKNILFGKPDDSMPNIDNNLEKACEGLISGVSETLRFYVTQEKSVPVRKVYVCGGFASARGFIELLNRRLGVEVVLWNPFNNVSCDAQQGCRDILDKSGHSLAVAAGFAMRSI